MANKTPQKGARAWPPPSSLDDADKLLGEIGEAARQIQRNLADQDDEVSAITAHYETLNGPLEETIKIKFAALMRYATANRARILPDDKKSLALSQGTIGFRSTPSKVEIEGDEELVIKMLLRRRLKDLCRVKWELDKNAIKANPERVANVPGIAIVPGENFFAEPLEVDTETVKLSKKVPAPRAAQREAA